MIQKKKTNYNKVVSIFSSIKYIKCCIYFLHFVKAKSLRSHCHYCFQKKEEKLYVVVVVVSNETYLNVFTWMNITKYELNEYFFR